MHKFYPSAVRLAACNSQVLNIEAQSICRPSHLWIPGGPKMAHAALNRRAIDGPHVNKLI